MKRLFDFLLSGAGLFIFLPSIIIIALLIFFKGGGSVFYKKKSLGENGIVFDVIKFRSMDEAGLNITKTGRFLRKTAMDELPQLVNILKGQMSFAGPRAYGIEKYQNADFFKRLSVPSGLAGLAQVLAPKHASDIEVLKRDMEYIKRRSFLLDMKIIFASVWITLRAGWEKTAGKL